MRIIIIVFFIIGFNCHLFGQTNEKALKISLQTDLIAYTTAGGWSAWLAAQHHQNKVSLAYVVFPDRYADYYQETGLKETDQFFRLQLARYLNPNKSFKNLYAGCNLEYHLRSLEEDNNPSRLEDTGFKIAPVLGYEWHPWNKKDNALENVSLAFWAGPTFLIGYNDELTFPGTGSSYEARESVEASVGVLLSYTLFKNY